MRIFVVWLPMQYLADPCNPILLQDYQKPGGQIKLPAMMGEHWVREAAIRLGKLVLGKPNNIYKNKRISSGNDSFEKCCNNVEKWLIERGNNRKLLKMRTSGAQEQFRNEVFDRENIYAKTNISRCSLSSFSTAWNIVKNFITISTW